MSTNKHIRTYVRPTRQFPESVQREGATGEEIYVEGKHVTLANFIKQLREGDVAEVQWLFLLADPKTKKNPRPAWSLKRRIKEIDDAGAIIEEWGSGKRLRISRGKDAVEMTFRAHKMIATSGRSQSATGKAGRPSWKTKKTPAQVELMKREWFSTRNKTNTQAVNRIIEYGVKDANPSLLWRMFGASGRVEIRKSRKRS